MSVQIHPIEGLPEVRPGDDLAALLMPALRGLPVRDGDVVAVTSKIVSKAEGRLVPGEDRADAVARETVRVVARRGDLVIAETALGFVCANAGVDASNVEAGVLALLPADPDGSAARLKEALGTALHADVAVVITDTFGRAWREGLVNVAIGCAGMPALIDLRGSHDHFGQGLEATIVALADEVAGATGLVMAKAARTPAAVVRGVVWPGDTPTGIARDLVRRSQDDLFRESPLQALYARRTTRSFGEGEVPRDALEEAVRAACTAPASDHARPWRFTVLTSEAAKRRIAGSDATLGEAPVLIVPWLSLGDGADRDGHLLSGGASVQTLLLALHAQGLASCWVAPAPSFEQEAREALGMGEGWLPLGTVACGLMPPAAAADPRARVDIGDIVDFV